jgi:hypothetical protein
MSLNRSRLTVNHIGQSRSIYGQPVNRSRLTVDHVGQCMGPEMRTDTTADTAIKTIATRNGTTWLVPRVRGDVVRSAVVVGIVVVLMAFLSFRAKGSGARVPVIRRTALTRIKHNGTVFI